MQRSDGRNSYDPRPARIIPDFLGNADGSCLIETGRTRVICTAKVEKRVPPFIQWGGWLSATYAMLPASTSSRKDRGKNRPDGRSIEIQRLIGRTLRGAVQLRKLDGITLWVDCDVIEADAGTRTAAITGGYVAVARAIRKLMREDRLKSSPLRRQVAAISVGRVKGEWLVDLDYGEDGAAEVDLNLVWTEEGLLEVQGTGEKGHFSPEELSEAVRLSEAPVRKLFALQKEAVEA